MQVTDAYLEVLGSSDYQRKTRAAREQLTLVKVQGNCCTLGNFCAFATVILLVHAGGFKTQHSVLCSMKTSMDANGATKLRTMRQTSVGALQSLKSMWQIRWRESRQNLQNRLRQAIYHANAHC